MAEFGDPPKEKSLEPLDAMKQPIKKLEPAINRFTKIAIPLDLDRLSNHCRNIQKFSHLHQWGKLRTEQINARRTVQQLKANVREMEKVRLQLCDSDLDEFDSQVSPVKEEVIQAAVRVIELCGVESSPLDPPIMSQSLTESPLDGDGSLRSRFRYPNSQEAISQDSAIECSDGSWEFVSQGPDNASPVSPLVQTQKEAPSPGVQESWSDLRDELVELNSLTHEFASQVQAQQELVDDIQANVDRAHSNVTSGVKSLFKASTYKTAMLPIGGALIGGIVGGPVGILAGVKMGAAAALGGSAIGFLGGRALKKRKDRKLEMEMSTLMNGSMEENLVESSKDK